MNSNSSHGKQSVSKFTQNADKSINWGFWGSNCSKGTCANPSEHVPRSEPIFYCTFRCVYHWFWLGVVYLFSLNCAISGQMRVSILQPPLIKQELICKHSPEQTHQHRPLSAPSSNDENMLVFNFHRSQLFEVLLNCSRFFFFFWCVNATVSHKWKPKTLQIRWALVLNPCQMFDFFHNSNHS